MAPERSSALPVLQGDVGEALESGSDERVLEAVERHGGVDEVLDAVFAQMAESFRPDRAQGREATAHYRLAGPGGVHAYTVRVEGDRCTAERGEQGEPRFAVDAGVPDFLRLVTGRQDQMQAFFTGKLKISGDMFFAQGYQRWFDVG